MLSSHSAQKVACEEKWEETFSMSVCLICHENFWHIFVFQKAAMSLTFICHECGYLTKYK